VKREIGAACSSCHDCSIRLFVPLECKTGSEVQQSSPQVPEPWVRLQPDKPIVPGTITMFTMLQGGCIALDGNMFPKPRFPRQ
jgi:hypothetical protein